MPISVGDTLMLSQVAWRLGRAFTAGRSNSPHEFREVELELSRLTKSLKLLAESLFLDDVESILAQADYSTRAGIATVVQFCKQTLDDLESLVEQYQVVRKSKTASGYAIERAWSELVVSNFKAMMWTAEGGNIQELRDTLHMHTSTTAVIRQALESKSLDRVEWTVAPISERIHSMIARHEGDVTEKVEEIERVVQSLVDQSPALGAAFDRVNSVGSNMSQLSLNGYNSDRESSKARRSPPLPRPSPLVTNLDGTRSTSNLSSVSYASSPETHWDSETVSSEQWESSCSSVGPNSPALRKSPLLSLRSPDSRRANLARSLPPLPPPVPPLPPLPVPPLRRSASDDGSIRLPPAAWDDNATIREKDSYLHAPTLPEALPMMLKRSASTISQQQTFEKELFKNSAIYCDLRGKSVQYIKPAEEGQRPSESQIAEVAEDCRICVVRRRETYGQGQVKFTTSIWTFSDDLSVRFQHQLPDLEDIIPFSSYFQEEKISITLPSELIFHDLAYGSPPLRTANSKWVNYVFEDEYASTSFQNTLFGRTLLDSYKTEKTMRIQDGIVGALSYSEQMCAMENLRLWEEESTGAVMVMIHYSAMFRQGYLTFNINDKGAPVKIKDDGGKTVKIKGLKIPMIDNDDSPLKRSQSFKQDGRRGSEGKKWITGAKIEFSNEEEKGRFLDTVRDLQVRAVTLRPR